MGVSPGSDRAQGSGNIFTRAGRRIDRFWQRVSDGLEVQALWSQFISEARASYSLYSREVDWEAIQRVRGFRRVRKTVGALFWAMVTKLSPARRVFLLIALFMGVLSITAQNQGEESAGGRGALYAFLSIGALFFLLALELADRVTMKRDLEIAREIQRWLVPETPPQVQGVDIAFTSRPANTVGGDYYDAFLRDVDPAHSGSERLLLVVADVAGKSVPAALLMATFQASLRTLAAGPTSLVELVTAMNHYSCAHSLGGRRFTTALFAELDPRTGALAYIRAGHNTPILLRATRRIERLEVGDLPLGIDTGVRYECGTTTLLPGDLLVIFSDGLVEAENRREEEFGDPRLLEVLQRLPPVSAGETLKHLLATVDAFTGSARQHDDITCLIARTS